jgi:hypothetical protein
MKDQPPIFNRYQHPFGHTSGASEIILTDPSSTHDPMASSLLGGNVVFSVGTNTSSSAMHL